MLSGCWVQIPHLPLASHGSWEISSWPSDWLRCGGLTPAKPTGVFSEECVNNDYRGARFFFGDRVRSIWGCGGHFSACLQDIDKSRWLSPWLQLPLRPVELAPSLNSESSVLPMVLQKPFVLLSLLFCFLFVVLFRLN